MNRPKGEVPFPENSWLMRYECDAKWHSIREVDAILMITKKYGVETERMVRNAKEGGMCIHFKYHQLMFITDSAYQDELYPLTVEDERKAWYGT